MNKPPFEINEANIRKYFRRFIDLNILTPIGEKKGRKYSLNDIK